VINQRLHKLILEAIDEVEQKQLDSFIAEFSEFNIKQAKQQLKELERKLIELKRNATQDLYSKHKMHTKPYQMAKKQFMELGEKISRYESQKDEMDTLAIKHKSHLLRKHGKIV
jgi:hypothetical protein